jgi:cysteine-rich repeat protein
MGDEECDDGNKRNDDGCTDLCQVEALFVCNNEPSRCTVTKINVLGGSEQCAAGLPSSARPLTLPLYLLLMGFWIRQRTIRIKDQFHV